MDPPREDEMWTMEFDGRCSNSGLGAGVVLISPNGELSTFSFKLDFPNTNNTTEYEGLLLGLQEAKLKGIRQLVAKGDPKLIVKQVQISYVVKNDWLKQYQNLVWDNIEFLEAFNIKAIPRSDNS